MNGNNFINLIGRLGQDPERKTFDNGGSLVEFSLATKDNYRDPAGNTIERTQWHRIKATGKRGDLLHQYCSRGRQLAVVGTLRYRDWTDSHGNKRKSAEVYVESFTFLESKRNGDNSYEEAAEQPRSTSLGPVQKLTEASTLVGDDGNIPF